MSVAVDVAPQRGHAVDIRVAVRVEQVCALGVVDHDRRLTVIPALLLGERMPEVTPVGGDQLGGAAHTEELIPVAGRNRRADRWCPDSIPNHDTSSANAPGGAPPPLPPTARDQRERHRPALPPPPRPGARLSDGSSVRSCPDGPAMA